MEAHQLTDSSTQTLYKIVNKDGTPCHGGSSSFVWPLPHDNEPGAWVEVDGPIVLCEDPCLHLTTDPAWCLHELGGDPSELVCCIAEYDGEILRDHHSHKVGVRRARLIRQVGWDTVRVVSSGHHTASGGYWCAWGNATVRALGNVRVRAWDNATVHAWDSVTVHAWGSATVRALGNATVISSKSHAPSATVALFNLAAHVDRRGGGLAFRCPGSEVSQ